MKYYYGNSYEEAATNSPVDIESTSMLEAYKDNYNVVVPAEDEVGLPDSVTVDRSEVDKYDDCITECINNYLSDTYGFCVFDYEYDDSGDEEITITNIVWDTEE